MVSRCPRSTVLTLALLLMACSTTVLAQKSSGSDSHLTVSVTVPTICTVAVTPGEWSADEAVDVQCRNLPEEHPQPQISEDAPASSDDATSTSEPMVVINF